MKNFDENELIDKAMAGRLTADEQRLWEALLAERPELQADLEIGRALRAIPPPPAVTSNFTALVLGEINKPAPDLRSGAWMNWLRWPRLAQLAALGVAVVGLSLQLHQRNVEKRMVAATVKTFTGGVEAAVDPMNPRPEAVVTLLQDFEAIRKLPTHSGDVDDDLLMALRPN